MSDTEHGLATSAPHPYAEDMEKRVTLHVLNAIHKGKDITQRSVSQDLGIALGLANAYFKRCVKKGLIKFQQLPPNRYAYFMTPRGFAEKSRLTAEYLSQSFNLFRIARGEYDAAAIYCATRQWHRVAFWGAGELGEVALLSFRREVTVAGFVDADATVHEYFGLPVRPRLADLETVDAVVITSLADPQGAFDDARAAIAPERVVAPPFLRVAASPPAIMME